MPRKTFGKNVLATLRFQPSNRGLVMDLQQAVFVRYVGFAFKWNSSLSTLHFTVDYSLDRIHWSDYVEDEQVKVKQFYVRVPYKTSHYEVSRRIFIKQPRRLSKRDLLSECARFRISSFFFPSRSICQMLKNRSGVEF